MGKIRQMYLKIIFLYGIFITAWVFWAAYGRQAAHAVARFFYRSSDMDAVYETTAIQFRYPEAFQRTLKKYKGFAELYCEEASTAIPGLAYTDLGESACSQMVPQGICIAGDYMLISAYDNGANAAWRKDKSYVPEKSVIYILSYGEGCSGEFLTTLVLPDVNHVGGLAFDGEHVWIAKSSSKALSAISYEKLCEKVEEAAGSGQSSIRLEKYDATISCGVTASFVSYYDQRLWVGTYSSAFKGQGSITTFSIEDGLILRQENTLRIPSCVQGIAFLEQDGEAYMALSASWGRFANSNLYLYRIDGEDHGTLSFRKNICLPPMSEELVSDGSHTYVLFESGATCYSSGNVLKCSRPVDRVCGLDNEGLLAGAVGR